ncbi:bestrophin family ion channel [uncultured Ruegeria sp.]|uniref:bestrophin family ion channel n=1 Tax=uncultured Ruegeria sp. TaxID=259304 RepID=UPI0026105FD7|nr:bestrophin family ion channel [uncultured Ruegeria sp.]
MVAFAHFLRGSLREVQVHSKTTNRIGEEISHAMTSTNNPANAAHRSMADQMGHLGRDEAIGGFGMMTISQTLSSLALAQVGCERIATTPLPIVYSLLVRRTTYLYCWLLPFALIESDNWFTPVFVAVVAYVFLGFRRLRTNWNNYFATRRMVCHWTPCAELSKSPQPRP